MLVFFASRGKSTLKKGHMTLSKKYALDRNLEKTNNAVEYITYNSSNISARDIRWHTGPLPKKKTFIVVRFLIGRHMASIATRTNP